MLFLLRSCLKGIRNPQQWKATIRKRRREGGQSYVDRKGRHIPARRLDTDKGCNGACRFKCTQNFCADKRKAIFDTFWSLNDEGKSHFYARNAKHFEKKNRKRTQAEQSRRKYSISYFFHLNDAPIRMCKIFFLSISEKRISYFFDQIYKKKRQLPAPTLEDLMQQVKYLTQKKT